MRPDLLTPTMKSLMAELEVYGEVVWLGGNDWRCIGRAGHSETIYHSVTISSLHYRGLIEPTGATRSNAVGHQRPASYQLATDGETT